MSIQKLRNMVDFSEKNKQALIKMSVSDAKKIIKEFDSKVIQEDSDPKQITLDDVIISGGRF